MQSHKASDKKEESGNREKIIVIKKWNKQKSDPFLL